MALSGTEGRVQNGMKTWSGRRRTAVMSVRGQI
jgi:hypothetical protein